MISTTDRGSSPNRGTCELTINLFKFEDSVTVTVVISTGFLDTNIIEELFSDILGLDIKVTKTVQQNATYFAVDFIGTDNEAIVSSEELADKIRTLSTSQKQQLLDAGVSVVDVTSNGPTATPPTEVPAPSVPVWAVVLIVVVNSLIVLLVLLIVVIIIWRRYRR